MLIPILFCLGGGLYCLLEVCFRGFTHPSMAAVGGLCVVLVYLVDKCALSTWRKMLLCGAGITAIEGICGWILNLALRMNVWDYSNQPFNLYGQVCVLFFWVWVFLSYPALLFCRRIQRYVLT